MTPLPLLPASHCSFKLTTSLINSHACLTGPLAPLWQCDVLYLARPAVNSPRTRVTLRGSQPCSPLGSALLTAEEDSLQSLYQRHAETHSMAEPILRRIVPGLRQ